MFESSRSNQIVCKGHRILPFFKKTLDEHKATCHVYFYDDGTRTKQLLNYDPLQITVHARLLGHNVLHHSTGRLEPDMF